MHAPRTTALLLAALAVGCAGTPTAKPTDEQKVSGTASGTAPSRAPATRAPTPTPTATPRPVPSATSVPTAPPVGLTGGKVQASFATRGLTRTQAREVVCYPTKDGDAVVKARFVLADASEGPSTALPTRFDFELDAAQLERDVDYTLAYRSAGTGGSALETVVFRVPASYATQVTPPTDGYTSTKLTLDEAGLTAEGEFPEGTTWRHALVYDAKKKLSVTAHAILAGTTDKFVISPIPGVDGGEEATVYIHADGRLVFKKTLTRALPVGQ